MAYLQEPAPARGQVMAVAPGVRRIVAHNPGPMTYHGTNTYLIDGDDGLMVLDPGPDDASHVQAILDATGGHVTRILLSHSHADHLGATAALQAATGAPVAAYHVCQDPDFAPDIALHDHDVVAGWTVLHTPGHARDHIAFAADGVVFSADHVMSWSSTVVSPPFGDMTDYFASLHRLLARQDRLFLPGHGPPLPEPQAYVRDLLAHRMQREAAILAALQSAPQTTTGLVDALYVQLDTRLHRAAERNVVAHLDKLAREGRAVHDGTVWRPIGGA